MITKIASKLTNVLVRRDVVSQEDVEIYVYGYEALISSLISFIVILTIGIFFHQGLQTLVFFVVFALTRVYSGGYHASSYITCNITISSIYVICILINDAINYGHISYPIIVLVLFYLSVILKFAPVPNPKKLVSSAESLKFREKILIISALWTIIIIVLYFFYIKVALNMAVTLFAVAVLIIVEHLVQKKGECPNEQDD